jgi:hypothetical protein
MIPLSDGIPARRFPIVNVSIIAANFLVWILYELPHLSSFVHHASFYPCSMGGSCHSAEPFLYQLVDANYGLFSASANGGGVAFFAHIGGFLFGVFVARAFLA